MKIKFEIKDNITIDNNCDRILEKRYKDGKKIQLTYDAVGNLIGKTRINGGMSTTIYSYNDQDQLSSVKEDGLIIASYGYDHKRQRVYSNSPGAQTYDGQKVYYWDTQGRIIGEQNISYAGVNANAATVRYIYSGNQKVAMARPKNLSDLNAGEDIYYFVNNAQGTPVLIVDSAGKSVSKINLDEWGNPGTVEGSRAEINYTGKKLDSKTGLYYFNQRYYDPEIGRFLTEDPKGQCFNPYLYSGNNPLMYVDPDGEFFQFLIPYLVAAIQGAAISAAANVTMQYAMTGQVNWQQVGQSAVGGALGGAMSFGVGEMFGHTTTSLGQFAGKTVAHGISGGLQSSLQGGSFGSGFMAGSVGHVAGELGGNIGGDLGGLVGSSLGGGISSALSGGDFGQGLQTGAMQFMFNKAGEGMVGAGMKMLGSGLRTVGGVAEKVPDSVYETASITGSLLAIAVDAPVVMCINGVINGGSLYKSYQQEGFSKGFFVNAGLTLTGLSRANPALLMHITGAGIVYNRVSK